MILDSTVFIAAERRGMSVRNSLADVAARFSGELVAVSVVTLIELAHGVARADSAARKMLRQRFLDELVGALPVHPITASIALRAGQIDGESTAKGIRLALSDLLIGVTAIELGFAVATSNLRHFEMIPGLRVVTL
jgi:tRNA(fMet)-specific endonuclease VapC